MSAALCLNSSGVTGKSKICATECTKSFLKLRSKSKKDVSVNVGWLKVRRTEYQTFEKQKSMPQALYIILGYLVCWSWHAYFKPKDHQIIGRPHGATILDRIMKNETANRTSPPPKSWMKPHDFLILVWRGGGIKFPKLFCTNIEGNLAEYFILITQDCAMKFLLRAAQYHGHLWRQNHDDKLVRVSGIFSRPDQ